MALVNAATTLSPCSRGIGDLLVATPVAPMHPIGPGVLGVESQPVRVVLRVGMSNAVNADALDATIQAMHLGPGVHVVRDVQGLFVHHVLTSTTVVCNTSAMSS